MKTNTYENRNGFELAVLPQMAPSLVATRPYHAMSDRYAYLPSYEHVKALYSEGFRCTKLIENKVRKEDKHGFQRHLLIFKHLEQQALIQGDNPVTYTMAFINSHDGTSALKLISALDIFACGNGLVVCTDKIDEQTVRHSGNKNSDDVIEASYRIINQAPRVAEEVKEMKGISLSERERIAFARAALELRWESDESIQPDGSKILVPTAPIKPESLLRVRRNADMGSDLFTTLNVVQEHIIKGGDHGRNKTGGYTTTRAVNSATESVKLNKALWVLADALKNNQ